MIHTIELQYEVYSFSTPTIRPGDIAPWHWYYRLGDRLPVGPFDTEAYARCEAEAALRGGHDYYSDEAFAARQRHQRNEEGDIPDPRAGG